MSIQDKSRRLDALERVVSSKGSSLPCAECGGHGGADEVRVVLLDAGADLLPGCESCGRARTPDGHVMALGATVVVLSGLDYCEQDEPEPPGGEGRSAGSDQELCQFRLSQASEKRWTLPGGARRKGADRV